MAAARGGGHLLGEQRDFQIGSIVRARGRDWIVLPATAPDVLNLKPVTGAGGVTTGLFLPLEGASVKSATFPRPDADAVGDPTAGCLLLDATRLLLRSSTAPFRCAGRLSFRPRPYQFLPLVLALKLHPVRLLIADDVGVGKTIEAAMIAREMLDRGLIRRMLILCPAHLCDQWVQELSEKFGLRPAIVQPSNLARLERELPRPDITIYEHFPCLVGSIDFLKSDRHKTMLLHSPPDLLIVDEAHLATRPRGTDPKAKGQQQRYDLVRALTADSNRHAVLVTATPHSGIEENFRSLLGLLNPEFDIGALREPTRQRLLPHIVQRRRADIEKWMNSETPFPERQPAEERPYSLSPQYKDLYDSVITYLRGAFAEPSALRVAQQRVRHWAAIAILRSILSSPESALATLTRDHKGSVEPDKNGDEAEPDEIYRPQVLDELFAENVLDQPPSAPLDDARAEFKESERRVLREFARKARAIVEKEADNKLHEAVLAVRDLIRDGYQPIVFCHFIPTANYVACELKRRLTDEFAELEIAAVTGDDPDEVRRRRIEELEGHRRHVLVATDCLSEGINLQEKFNAVVHYDLPWNPNRLEQREGRVDRFGQPKLKVRRVTIWGRDNEIDQAVLDVLIRKAQRIRRDLGIAVPVPADAGQVIEAVVENVLFRRPTGKQLALGLAGQGVITLHEEWDRSAEREKENRAYYKHPEIEPEEVAADLEINDQVLGDPDAVRRFIAEVCNRFNGSLTSERRGGVFVMNPGDLAARLRAIGRDRFPTRVTFDRLKDPDALYLGRAHPVVEETCHAVLAQAFDRTTPDLFFARAGANFTLAIQRRTALLLMRIRYIIQEAAENFAEEVLMAAFHQDGSGITWLTPIAEAKKLIDAPLVPGVNMPHAERTAHVRWALDLLDFAPDTFAAILKERRQEIEKSNNRLRGMLKQGKIQVIAHPPDILGLYVLVPGASR
jgi:superfamily II DNA or RNA helicase